MTSFDVFVLDVSHNGGLIALASRGADTAIEPIPIGPDLHALVTFGRLLGAAVSGQAQRPSAAALNKFGQSLFGYLFRGQIKSLYDRLPTGPVSIQILSNRSEAHEVPWEYLVTPDLQVSPGRAVGERYRLHRLVATHFDGGECPLPGRTLTGGARRKRAIPLAPGVSRSKDQCAGNPVSNIAPALLVASSWCQVA